MSSRDDFTNLTYRWLRNEELTKPEEEFVVQYLLRYLKGKPVEDYRLPDIIDWTFTGNNIIFDTGGISIPVDEIFTGYYGTELGLTAGDKISEMYLYGNTLYVMGNFETIAGVSTNNAAMFDITTGEWTAMPGLTAFGGIFTIAVDSNGLVYAGGTFQVGAGVAGFASWDGSNWTDLTPSGMTEVDALLANGTDIYIGGTFSNAGGDANQDNIALYNGSVFSALGTGMDDAVYGLDLDSSGNLYAVGAFQTAGGTAAVNVAKWNGSTWAAMGDGVGINGNYANFVLVSSTDVVYVGGQDGANASNPGGHIAKWTGAAWITLGGGTSDDVNAMAEDSAGNIYAVGDFIYAGGKKVNRIARWDGSSWNAVGTGFSPELRTIAIDSNDVVYVGGDAT